MQSSTTLFCCKTPQNRCESKSKVQLRANKVPKLEFQHMPAKESHHPRAAADATAANNNNNTSLKNSDYNNNNNHNDNNSNNNSNGNNR